MASQFFIEVNVPKDPDGAPRVRMIDNDQEETTPWVDVDQALRGQPDEVIFAAALLTDEPLQQMVSAARQVAYAVWLNDDPYDVHAVTPQRMQALVSAAHLDATTSSTASPKPSRRM